MLGRETWMETRCIVQRTRCPKLQGGPGSRSSPSASLSLPHPLLRPDTACTQSHAARPCRSPPPLSVREREREREGRGERWSLDLQGVVVPGGEQHADEPRGAAPRHVEGHEALEASRHLLVDVDVRAPLALRTSHLVCALCMLLMLLVLFMCVGVFLAYVLVLFYCCGFLAFRIVHPVAPSPKVRGW